MKPVEELKEEHRAIKIMARILLEISRRLEAGESPEIKDLNDIIDFLKVFAESCHHRKEEKLLFPALEKAGISREEGPVGVILKDHECGRGMAREMEEALDRMIRGEERAGLNFARQARAYADLLINHIEKEDNVLFPLAENHLSQKTQNDLGKDFKRIEKEIAGAGLHRTFERLLNRLEKKYLRSEGSA